MNYEFAEASIFFFLFFPPDIRHCQQNESSKYSIKTSGLNSSFIILRLICNCRFVFWSFVSSEITLTPHHPAVDGRAPWL